MIGTFNVESPQPNAFGEEDLQFAEIFSREIAAALHTLELLSAEKRSTATQSIEAISREVALPVDDILAAATAVLDRYIGHEPEMADKLRQILASARSHQAVHSEGGRGPGPGARGRPSPQRRFAPALEGDARAGGRQRRARPPLGARHPRPLRLRRRDRPRRPGGADHGPAGHLRRRPGRHPPARSDRLRGLSPACASPSRSRASSS